MKRLLFITIAGSFIVGPAIAQDYTSTSTSTSNSYSNSIVSQRQSGTLYTTPSVPQSAYFAGANPCLVGVGAGGSGGPIGLSIAFGRNDDACQRRSDAAAWHALGMDDVAVARMLQDDDNLKAFYAAGRTNIPPAAPQQVVPQGNSMPPDGVSSPKPGTVPAPTPVPGAHGSNGPSSNVVAYAAVVSNRYVPDWCDDPNSRAKVTAVYLNYMCGK